MGKDRFGYVKEYLKSFILEQAVDTFSYMVRLGSFRIPGPGNSNDRSDF